MRLPLGIIPDLPSFLPFQPHHSHPVLLTFLIIYHDLVVLIHHHRFPVRFPELEGFKAERLIKLAVDREPMSLTVEHVYHHLCPLVIFLKGADGLVVRVVGSLVNAVGGHKVGDAIEVAVGVGSLEEPVVSALPALVGREEVLLAFEEVVFNARLFTESMFLIIIELPRVVTLRLVPWEEVSPDPAESPLLKRPRIPVKLLKLKLAPAVLLTLASLPLIETLIAVSHCPFAMRFPINIITDIRPVNRLCLNVFGGRRDFRGLLDDPHCEEVGGVLLRETEDFIDFHKCCFLQMI